MNAKTLLTFIDKSDDAAIIKPVMEWAWANNWHLTVQIIGIASLSPVYAYSVSPYGGPVYPDNWHEQIEAEAKEVSDKVDQVEKLLQSEGLSANVINSYCEKFLVEELVAEAAKISDLAVLLPGAVLDTETLSRITGGLLFRSPIALITNMANPEKSLSPKKLFIAWDTSLQAARAVHHALPLLMAADEVVIGLFDPVDAASIDGEDPGADVAQWLSRQGCRVTLQQYPSGGKEIGEVIVKRAREVGADLIIMGAFGHSRMRERIFGGTTQTILNQAQFPVLMAH